MSTDSSIPVLPADTEDPGLVERARRFSSVVALAAHIYGGYKCTQLWTRFVSAANKTELYRRQDLRSARALYRTAISLEGLLIKTAQFIATRADLLPDEWVSTLAGLHDRVPPRSFAMIKHRIETELRRPLDEVFAEFDETPIASASLAQVHRARLHDGRVCAVKVQYPGIDGIVRADLRNLTFVLKVLAWVEPTRPTPEAVIDWLRRHDVPFDEIHVGKPWCGTEGFYVDDRAVRPSEFLSLSRGQIAALIAGEA